MIDLRLLRDDLESVRSAYARRGGVPELEKVVKLDREHRRLLGEVEDARAEHNRASKSIGSAIPSERPAAIEAARSLADRLKELEPELERAETELRNLASYLPNLPHESVPEGLSEEDNVTESEVGDRPQFDFPPVDHATLGQRLGIFDAERATKTSGSRFVYLTGPGAVLELSLIRFAVDFLAQRAFTPVITPVLVRERAMYGTGFLPAEEREIYKIERDELFLAGTSEVALAAMHADEIVDAARLPVRYAGLSTNFRREAGTYGKDTQGLIRLHQFDKVEQFSLAHPDSSWEEYDSILENERDLIGALEIPYRVVVMCGGDLGAMAAKKVDHEAWLPASNRFLENERDLLGALEIPYRVVVMCGGDLGAMAAKKVDHEAWLPASNRFLEVTSATNATDYQSRRLQIRFREGGKTRLVHTLNGTAIAIGRTIVALLENHQRADGSVGIPKALQPYTGFEEIHPVA